MEPRAGDSRPDIPLLSATLLALVLWASAFVAIRLGMREYPPGSLALLRFLVAGIGLALYQLVRPTDRIRLPARRHLPSLVMTGLVGITLYHVALNAGERTVTAGSASLIVSLSPIFTALFATVSLGERLGALGWAGVLTGFVGAAVVSLSEQGTVRLGAGSLLVLIAAIAQAVYFVLQKPLLLLPSSGGDQLRDLVGDDRVASVRWRAVADPRASVAGGYRRRDLPGPPARCGGVSVVVLRLVTASCGSGGQHSVSGSTVRDHDRLGGAGRAALPASLVGWEHRPAGSWPGELQALQQS